MKICPLLWFTPVSQPWGHFGTLHELKALDNTRGFSLSLFLTSLLLLFLPSSFLKPHKSQIYSLSILILSFYSNGSFISSLPRFILSFPRFLSSLPSLPRTASILSMFVGGMSQHALTSGP